MAFTLSIPRSFALFGDSPERALAKICGYLSICT